MFMRKKSQVFCNLHILKSSRLFSAGHGRAVWAKAQFKSESVDTRTGAEGHSNAKNLVVPASRLGAGQDLDATPLTFPFTNTPLPLLRFRKVLILYAKSFSWELKGAAHHLPNANCSLRCVATHSGTFLVLFACQIAWRLGYQVRRPSSSDTGFSAMAQGTTVVGKQTECPINRRRGSLNAMEGI